MCKYKRRAHKRFSVTIISDKYSLTKEASESQKMMEAKGIQGLPKKRGKWVKSTCNGKMLFFLKWKIYFCKKNTTWEYGAQAESG